MILNGFSLKNFKENWKDINIANFQLNLAYYDTQKRSETSLEGLKL